MSKELKNQEIIEMMKRNIGDKGLSDRLEMDPIYNGFKKRPHYRKKEDGMCVFTTFMWQLNSLSGKELEDAIEERIKNAISHFDLKGKK